MSTVAAQLIVATSLLWFILRLIAILRTPRSILLESLGLVRPERPEVTVDALGDTWVSIRWHASSRKGCRRYRVQIGRRTFEVGKYDETAVLDELDADTTYCVSVCGVGQHDRLGEAAKISVHTLTSPEDRAPHDAVGVFHETSDNPTLESLQRSTKEVLDQINQANMEFCDENGKLQQLLTQLIDIKKSEDSFRGHLRGELKVAEDFRHSLEFQKAKLGRRLEATKERLSLLTISRDKVKAEATRFRKEAEKVNAASLKLSEQEGRRSLMSREKTASNYTGKDSLSVEQRIADDILEAKGQLHNVETERAQTRACIETIRRSLSSAVIDNAFETLCELVSPELVARLKKDVEIENMTDKAWALAQTEMERKYIAAYQIQQSARNAYEQSALSRPALNRRPTYPELYTLNSAISTNSSMSPHPIQTVFSGTALASGSRTPPEAESPSPPALSPTAGGLIPSNLFQEQSVQSTPGRDESHKLNSNSDQEWSPSVSRTSLGSSRKKSLFFSQPGQEDGIQSKEPPSPIQYSKRDSKESPLKTPKRGLSGRIMSNFENKHGNFVKRLSFFSRKDNEEPDLNGH